MQPDVVNKQAVADNVQSVLSVAGLNDFERKRGDNGIWEIICKTNGASVEVRYSPMDSGDPPIRIEQIEIREADRLPLTIVADAASKEPFVQKLGASIVERFQSLSSMATRKGINCIRYAFCEGKEINSNDAHLTDLSLTTTEDGKRQVKGLLVIQGAMLVPRKEIVLNLGNPAEIDLDLSRPSSPEVAPRKIETLTLEVTLTEEVPAESDVSLLERPVELECWTREGYGISSNLRCAKTIFAALQAFPDLSSMKALCLGDLASIVNRLTAQTARTEEICALQKKLRNSLLFHISDSEPISRTQLSEDDFIVHAVPGSSPGLDLQAYRIKELEQVDDGGGDPQTFRMKVRNAEGGESLSAISTPEKEKYIRRIIDTELPNGQQGLINLVLDHDLQLEIPSITRWTESSDLSIDGKIKANKSPDIDLHTASVKDGVLSWEMRIKDPLVLALLEGVDSDTKLPVVPDDGKNIKAESNKTEATIQRHIPGIPRGEFVAPGYWRLSPRLIEQLEKLQQALDACSYADVVALTIGK